MKERDKKSEASMKNLGRGLSSLLGEELEENLEATHEVGIDLIVPDPRQPRTHFSKEEMAELVHSISVHGILQPLLVRPREGGYSLVAGERRWQAAKVVGLRTVPVIVKDISDKLAIEISIVENVQRENLNVLDEAASYKRLIDEYQYRTDDVARTIGKSRSYVANTVRLLKLPESLQKLVQRGEMSAGHARALLSSQHPEDDARSVISKALSVRETEALVRRRGSEHKQMNHKSTRERRAHETIHEAAPEESLRELSEHISQRTGLRITIQNTSHGGVLSIGYHTPEQLDRIVESLSQFKAQASNNL